MITVQYNCKPIVTTPVCLWTTSLKPQVGHDVPYLNESIELLDVEETIQGQFKVLL